MTSFEIARLISGTVFRFADERGLQDGIETLLRNREVSYTREVVLSPKDRVDFMVGKIGIEVKVDASLSVVQRQLWRYAAQESIDALILVTTRSKHKGLPSELLGKPLLVVHLLSSIF